MFNAKRILKSDQQSGTVNNDLNALKGMLDYTVNHYLTDTDAWFILCEDNELNMFQRRAPDFEQGSDFDTEDAKYKATARWSTGWSEWRGVYGTQGA